MGKKQPVPNLLIPLLLLLSQNKTDKNRRLCCLFVNLVQARSNITPWYRWLLLFVPSFFFNLTKQTKIEEKAWYELVICRQRQLFVCIFCSSFEEPYWTSHHYCLHWSDDGKEPSWSFESQPLSFCLLLMLLLGQVAKWNSVYNFNL